MTSDINLKNTEVGYCHFNDFVHTVLRRCKSWQIFPSKTYSGSFEAKTIYSFLVTGFSLYH